MYPETSLEKKFHDLLSRSTDAKFRVTFGYQQSLHVIQNHLQTFYGKRADWKQCLSSYFHSDTYKGFCHDASCCEEIPILSNDELYQMVQDDQDFQANINRFLQLNQKIKDAGEHPDSSDIYQAAEILGILPEQKTPGLYSWLILRDHFSEEEKEAAWQKIAGDLRLMALIVDLFSTLFMPGMQLTFPPVGTAMTQQKNRFFYRGENAFYASSRPGLFRLYEKRSAGQRTADQLLLNEACFFLDQFDAVKRWGVSNVNYLALAQHYGVKTPMMDLTTNLKTALFFACCKYKNGLWQPMVKKDFAKNARYGILYRSPTEITEMKRALSPDEANDNLITPIGYQPFMRCSAQYGYMLFVRNPSYDMLVDPLFDKFRILHDEDFCRWIFEEMECGNQVYPYRDIPNIERYMQGIRNSHSISRKTFDFLIFDQLHASPAQADMLLHQLQKDGYRITDRPVQRIPECELRKINRKYSFEAACNTLDISPLLRPMVILPSDTIVEIDEEE